ncbi:MAG: ABC transporter ATP-binding protein [Synechococcaceae cyanobacterium RM1_1_27]|nr:ABC transporter ATP-binding protein [Synechococcaceae cyanobacterium SM2_3_2]NJO85372.1 ABC transporter ATP-binding protein [Synechococcaceae cyanobacterium RM1_1_27]
MSELILTALSKQFKGIPAVSHLNLRMESGEIVALLGPSGCGKSTTLQMIAGILAPDGGSIELGGRRLNGIPPQRRGIAMMLQRGLLFPHLTVGENVAFALKMKGINRPDREAQAQAMLERVHLGQFGPRRPSELSGGQAQRVALARSLVMQPQLLLLDEPLSALDANLRDQMQALILELQAQIRLTTLWVTHDQAEASLIAHRIGLMFAGSLAQVGSPAEFYQTPRSVAVARFFGGINFWPGLATGSIVALESGPRLTLQSSVYGATQVTIRPERVEVFDRVPPRINALEARVVARHFSGIQQRLSLQMAGIPDAPPFLIQAWLPPTQPIRELERVWVVLPPEALWCIPCPGSEVISAGIPKFSQMAS